MLYVHPNLFIIHIDSQEIEYVSVYCISVRGGKDGGGVMLDVRQREETGLSRSS